VVKDPKQYTFNKVDHYAEDVWVINREYWKGKIKTPTKLPSEIIKKILLYSSNHGDLVFDPFLGSGTVAIVSQTEGRHFLGFEIVPEYFAFANECLRCQRKRM
jgi:site-specific DNA-methyltransferase (adenine-specific)